MSLMYLFFLLAIIVQPSLYSARYADLATPPLGRFSIMLDPAGDAQDAGRIIDDSFERSIALAFTQELKKELETCYIGKLRVILTRLPGETIQPLHNAQCANRLNVDLYIRIQFYQGNPAISLYHFSYGQDVTAASHPLTWQRYDKAYLNHAHITTAWAHSMSNVLRSSPYTQHFTYHGAYSLPLRPLIGICGPAFIIEAGISNKDGWRFLITPLADSIGTILTKHCAP